MQLDLDLHRMGLVLSQWTQYRLAALNSSRMAEDLLKPVISRFITMSETYIEASCLSDCYHPTLRDFVQVRCSEPEIKEPENSAHILLQ
jgi:hypothetical protein